MKKTDFPENTQSAVYIDKLIISKDKRLLSERMSSRMVRSASVMDKGDYVGWQMFVPTKGLVKMSAFGSAGVGTDDLTWMIEKTGRANKSKSPRMAFDNLTDLYEIYLPVTEKKTCQVVDLYPEKPKGKEFHTVELVIVKETAQIDRKSVV